jgi:hypothetical protein
MAAYESAAYQAALSMLKDACVREVPIVRRRLTSSFSGVKCYAIRFATFSQIGAISSDSGIPMPTISDVSAESSL